MARRGDAPHAGREGTQPSNVHDTTSLPDCDRASAGHRVEMPGLTEKGDCQAAGRRHGASGRPSPRSRGGAGRGIKVARPEGFEPLTI